MNRRTPPRDGDTRQCPQCRDLLFFSSRHPVLSVSTALTAHEQMSIGGIRYERGWFCSNDD